MVDELAGIAPSNYACIAFTPLTPGVPCSVTEYAPDGVVRRYSGEGRILAVGTIVQGTFVPREQYAWGRFGPENWISSTPSQTRLDQKSWSYGDSGRVAAMALGTNWFTAHLRWPADGGISGEALVDGGAFTSAKVEVDAGSISVKWSNGNIGEAGSILLDAKGTTRWETFWKSTCGANSCGDEVEFDERARLTRTYWFDDDRSSETRLAWEGDRLVRIEKNQFGMYAGSMSLRTRHYDGAGRLVVEQESGKAWDGPNPARSLESITFFQNACESGEPLEVRRYTADRELAGSVTYLRDDLGRLSEEQYDGEAVRAFQRVKRVFEYCDSP